jgi:F-type H+-transporting ATPase subunit gamma
MAKARALDKRRKSIRNIRKITRTMELISTARFKRAMNRATAAAASTRRVVKVVADLVRSGLAIEHPLLELRQPVNSAALLVLTANRGLCGGYNSSVLRAGRARLEELQALAPHVDLEVSGKRGISAFRFRGVQPDQTFTHFEDRPSFDEVKVLADHYLESYEAKQLDRLDVAYTRFESASRQRAVVETLLPLVDVESLAEEELPSARPQFEFLPSAKSILDEIVPVTFTMKLFKCFLDAAVSEQIARMVAMKAATENADAMVSHLSMVYNRARQGQITNELLEIIGGAEALNK